MVLRADTLATMTVVVEVAAGAHNMAGARLLCQAIPALDQHLEM